MTLSDVRARFRRGFARMWEWIKARFKKRPQAAWGTEPRDDVHALYRERFERFAEGMPHLPRTKTNETTEAFLAVSQTAQMLHEYGDDPIRVPETGRIIRPDDRLATFGAVGQPMGFVGSLGSSASLWIVAAGLVVCGSGWVTNEISSANYKAERAAHSVTKAELEDQQVANAVAVRERDIARERLEIAQTQQRQSAETLRQERALLARAAESERRRLRELQQINNGGAPPDWERGLRDDSVGEGGPPAAGGRDSSGARSR